MEPEVACEGGWVARPFVFAYFPQGDDQERGITLPAGGPATEHFGLDDGYGVGVSFEKRIHSWLGFEAAATFGRGDSEYEVTSATRHRRRTATR